MILFAMPAAPAAPLPAGLSDGDVGGVGLAGQASFSQGIFTVSASGSDIWNAADQFHYVYQALHGDGTIVARVDSLNYTDFFAKAGVMIRGTMDPGSMNAMIEITAGGQSYFQWRGSNGGSSSAVQGPSVQAPYWVKLVRTGGLFTGYVSADGQSWVQVTSAFISMPTNVYVGLAVTAHNNTALTTATFDQVAVTSQAVSGNVAIDAGGVGAGSFLPDQDFSNLNGATFTTGNPIDTSGVTNPAPQEVYQSERWGAMTYTISNLTPAQQYGVRLHFAEIYWSGPGQRLFDVAINGKRVLHNFDVFATAGGADKAVIKLFLAQADHRGRIVVQFLFGPVDNPKLSGIEVRRADGQGSQVAASGQSFQETAGQSTSAVVASFSDSGSLTGSNFTATIFWGDGTSSVGQVQTNGPGSFSVLGTPAYAQPGLYKVSVLIRDQFDRSNVMVQGTANVVPATSIAVFVGYYDNEHANPTLPNPWNGSPNVTFWGGTTDGFYDTGAVLIQNLGSQPVVIGPGFYVDGFANQATFQLWDSYFGSGFSLQPGQSLILTQTAGRDFDTSDQPIISNPADRTNNLPVVHVTMNGQLVAYVDEGQVLNTGGFDPGNAYGTSESIPWQAIGPIGWAPAA
jgi:regulation of enolase protein 1 (concanavalin A-like superfamily)